MPLLVASQLEKSFAGVRALAGLSFELAAGEVHALVGENGAGKSTFVRIITGAEIGRCRFAGDRRRDRSRLPRRPRRARTASRPSTSSRRCFPTSRWPRTSRFPSKPGGAWSRVNWRRRVETSRALLERLGASIDVERTVDTLSLPEQQLVEIAKAVGADARILLMDEPTAALTDPEVDRLFAVVTRLRASGVGVVYISHRLDEVRRIADRVTVIRDGRTVASGLAPGHGSRGDHPDDGRPGRRPRPRAARARPGGGVALEVRGLSSESAGVEDVSFSASAGEILGVAGLVGSGRTELAETLFGLRPADAGEIYVRGARHVFRSPAEAVRAGLAYVPEDRRRHGVLADLSVAANTSLASLARVSVSGFLQPAGGTRPGRPVHPPVPHPDAVDRHRSRACCPEAISRRSHSRGGWPRRRPILILDEPTQGVDVGAKAEIHALMRELAAEGLAIVMISSDLPEILAMSDRVLVMRQGRSRGVLDRSDASAEAILALAVDRHGPVDAARPSSRCRPTALKRRSALVIARPRGRAGGRRRPGSSNRRISRDLVLANVPVLIAAIGATLVILTGEIDISVGSAFAVCSVFAGALAAAGAPISVS